MYFKQTSIKLLTRKDYYTQSGKSEYNYSSIFSSSEAQQFNLVQGNIAVEFFGSHTVRNTLLVILFYMSDKLVALATTYATNTRKTFMPSTEFEPTTAP
jgi:hypothetical protein